MQSFGLGLDRFKVLDDVEQDHFWFTARRNLITGLLQQTLPTKVPILLDLGCGPGANLRFWRAFANRVIGIDQHAQTAPHIGAMADDPAITMMNGDATDVPFDDASVDAVLLLDVLEHVDDQRVLDETHRVLGADGVLLLSVPAHPWLWGARDRGASHLRRYTRRGLRARVEAAGFSVVKIRPYQFCLLPLVILSRLFGKFSNKTRDMEDRPTPIVNAILKWINQQEVRASLHIAAMPTGSSFVLIARKRG